MKPSTVRSQRRRIPVDLIGLASLMFTMMPQQPLECADRPLGHRFATRSEVFARNGMVATSQPLAAQAGLNILRDGGNAVDAAIAANAVMGLMEPTGNGIGGDLFAIVWVASEKRLYGLNASGRSPGEMTLENLTDQGLESIPAYGPLPVTVPGCVDGWFELRERFGTLPMGSLLKPAIDYAREGFPVSEVIASGWASSVPVFEKYPGFSEVFAPEGRAPKKGEIFRNPALANTLEQIAREGRDSFYRGPIAETIVAYLREQGGYHRVEDFASHRSEWVEPVSVDYRGYRVWELPPNTQGIAALQMLNILEGYDLRAMGYGSVQYTHLFIEAKKLAFEDRAKYYADQEFYPTPLKTLLSKDYAAQRRGLIDPYRASMTPTAGDAVLEDGDTIYLTAADRWGNMVSLIQSNYRGMGSGMTPPSLGFMLQDRGELFSLDPDHANAYEPNKRPFHTIIPAFVTKDGEPILSFGVMGGAMQPQGHAQIVVNVVDFDMNLQEAGDAPRIRHIGSSQPTGEVIENGGVVYLESGFPDYVIDRLKDMGHRISNGSSSFGGYQAIGRDPESAVYAGASESRKDGQAVGY